MNSVELKMTLAFSACAFDIVIRRDFLGNSLTKDPHTHSHPTYEFQYIEKGSCIFSYDGRDIFCPEGCVIIVPPKLRHRICPEAENTVTATFSYQPHANIRPNGLIATFMSDKPQVFIDDGNIKERLESIRMLLSGHLPFFRQKIQGEMTLLFAEAASLSGSEDNEQNPSGSENRAEIIEDYIAAHCFESRFSLTELAEVLHLSPRHLQRLCISYFGVPFRTKLHGMRMEIARYRLQNTTCTVAELSRQLGYSSPSAFSAAYKRFFGVYPTKIK